MTRDAKAAFETRKRSRVSGVRALLAKAEVGVLTQAETIFLKGELARLQSKAAAVNAKVGRKVIELGSFARIFSETGASAAAAV
jgi:hypothetical protein